MLMFLKEGEPCDMKEIQADSETFSPPKTFAIEVKEINQFGGYVLIGSDWAEVGFHNVSIDGGVVAKGARITWFTRI